ncbi:MAG: UDP-N-acetylmuramoyl-L-alanine--D-glutamate ligase, partial [Candidatus Gastranaerophilales bacterium]|nr:UDP-N-acetylmuramoyl-L-alanine--D-glutamate ligase [Candidatus Gastranaerophilales bacterium]
MGIDWSEKKIVILGFSISGIASARYLAKKVKTCIISERRDEKIEDALLKNELANLGVKIEFGEHKKETLLTADLIIISPGIPPHSEVIQFIKNNNLNYMSEIELAFLETKNPFITITGTNGKTTTVKLVSEIFQNAGYNAPACGNIGIPPISLIENNPDFFVTELSSFQIEYSKNFKPEVGAFLNYSPDHVDWHGNADEYLKSKSSLFLEPKTPKHCILNALDDKVMNLALKIKSNVITFGAKTTYPGIYINDLTVYYSDNSTVEPIIDVKEIPIIGEHNQMNIMAACAIAKIFNIPTGIIKQTISKFKPPEHRLEFVTSINNVKYYNDSKATNCDSAICALKAFDDKNIALIAGGKDKGTDLTELCRLIKEKTTYTILIGQAADRINNALIQENYDKIYRASSLEEAIDIAGNLNV